MKYVVRFTSVVRVCMLVILWVCSSAASALTIQQVVKDTLDNNPDIKVARQEALAREHEIRNAKAGYLPTLDAEVAAAREWSNSPSTLGTGEVILDRREAVLRMRQMVYDGNAVSHKVNRQKARYQSALFSAVSTEENAVLRACQAYIDVLRKAELLSLLKQSLDEHQVIFDQISLRSKAGVGNRADVDQISVRLSLATSNFIAGTNNFLDSLSKFQGLVGYIPDASEMEVPQDFVLPSSLEASLSLAFNEHPTIKSAAADIEAAKALHAEAKSKHHPTLHLEGDRTWNDHMNGVAGKNEDWMIALRLRYNLYNGGADTAERNKTAEQIAKMQNEYTHTRWETEEGMRLSWYAYESTKQQLEHLAIHVQSVEKTKEAYQKQFNIGKRTLLDLLNTESELVSAKETYANTKYDQLYSQIRVLNSSGQLTKVFSEE